MGHLRIYSLKQCGRQGITLKQSISENFLYVSTVVLKYVNQQISADFCFQKLHFNPCFFDTRFSFQCPLTNSHLLCFSYHSVPRGSLSAVSPGFILEKHKYERNLPNIKQKHSGFFHKLKAPEHFTFPDWLPAEKMTDFWKVTSNTKVNTKLLLDVLIIL